MSRRSSDSSLSFSLSSASVGSELSHIGEPQDGKASAPLFETPQVKQEPMSYAMQVRQMLQGSTWAKVLFGISLTSAVVVLAFQCFLFGIIARNLSSLHVDGLEFSDYVERLKKNTISTYLALYIIAEIYQALYTVLILSTKNVYHLAAYLVFLCAMTGYSGIQYHELGELYTYENHPWVQTCRAFSILVIVLSAVTTLVQAFVAWKLLTPFARATGERVGNNIGLIRSNVVFNLHRAGITISWFFIPAFTIQFAIFCLSKTDPEFIVTMVILALSFAVLVLADYCAAREFAWGMYLAFLAYMGGLAYLAFKLFRLFTMYVTGFPGRRSLIAFDIFCMVLLIWLAVLCVLVRLNFGKGLKQIYSQDYHYHKKQVRRASESL